jgi:hypothetical protein
MEDEYLYLLPLAALAVITAAMVAMISWAKRRERERSQGLEEAARSMGWSWAAEQPLDVIPGLERFGFFGQGHHRSIRNFVAGERDGVRAAAFDYQFTVGHGKSSSTQRQSVVYLRSATLALPAFSVRPEHVLHRVGGAFGYQDIDFPDRPEFSRRCLLRGADEAAVRAAFPEAATAFFEGETRWCADGEGEELLLWRGGRLATPAELPGVLAAGMELLGRLRPESRARA